MSPRCVDDVTNYDSPFPSEELKFVSETHGVFRMLVDFSETHGRIGDSPTFQKCLHVTITPPTVHQDKRTVYRPVWRFKIASFLSNAPIQTWGEIGLDIVVILFDKFDLLRFRPCRLKFGSAPTARMKSWMALAPLISLMSFLTAFW